MLLFTPTVREIKVSRPLRVFSVLILSIIIYSLLFLKMLISAS